MKIGDRVILDGAEFSIADLTPVLATLHSTLRDVDFPDHPPHYIPSETGPYNIAIIKVEEMVWFAPGNAWTLPGRLEGGNTVSLPLPEV